jgi:hypothetical protein
MLMEEGCMDKGNLDEMKNPAESAKTVRGMDVEVDRRHGERF